jgi:putative acetyltransferase
MQVTIRDERESDIQTIHALERAAFGRRQEADIVDILRAAGALWLSQVALHDGEIVGHAAYSLVTITQAAKTCEFPALGPIGVWPRYQKRGIGTALIEAGFEAMQRAGYGMLFLVGHTSYYPRFGFQPALPLGFSSDYVSDPQRHEHFMVRVFDESLIGRLRGHMRYHAAFDEG